MLSRGRSAERPAASRDQISPPIAGHARCSRERYRAGSLCPQGAAAQSWSDGGGASNLPAISTSEEDAEASPEFGIVIVTSFQKVGYARSLAHDEGQG